MVEEFAARLSAVKKVQRVHDFLLEHLTLLIAFAVPALALKVGLEVFLSAKEGIFYLYLDVGIVDLSAVFFLLSSFQLLRLFGSLFLFLFLSALSAREKIQSQPLGKIVGNGVLPFLLFLPQFFPSLGFLLLEVTLKDGILIKCAFDLETCLSLPRRQYFFYLLAEVFQEVGVTHPSHFFLRLVQLIKQSTVSRLLLYRRITAL